MDNRYKFWSSCDDVEKAKKAICGKYDEDKLFEPALDTVKAIGEQGGGAFPTGHFCLDFGCGIGRNTYMLGEYFEHVVGFDFPNMIKMAKQQPQYTHATGIMFTSDWDLARKLPYDAIWASLVFQHLHPDDLAVKSHELSLMAPLLMCNSRWYTDFKRTPVWDILSNDWSVISESVPSGLLYTGDDLRVHWCAFLRSTRYYE